jgi:hypothetical protein
MTRLEALLRLSMMQVELRQLADVLDEDGAKVTNYAANVLNLLRRSKPDVPEGPTLKLIVGGRSSSGPGGRG